MDRMDYGASSEEKSRLKEGVACQVEDTSCKSGDISTLAQARDPETKHHVAYLTDR